MSIEYGFFESVDDDRLYYSDSFNKYFKGMYRGESTSYSIEGSGVFRDVGSGLTVTSGPNPLEVVVTSGKAMVNYHWFEMIDEAKTFVLSKNTGFNDRVDMLVLRYNGNNEDYYDSNRSPDITEARSVGFAILTGGSNGKAPSPYIDALGANNDIVELPLALILALIIANKSKINVALRTLFFIPYVVSEVIEYGGDKADIVVGGLWSVALGEQIYFFLDHRLRNGVQPRLRKTF